MKVFGLFLFIAIMTSCNNESSDNQEKTDFRYDGGMWDSMEYSINEERIDGCEYIVIFGVDGRNIIHKANCDNPFHSHN